MKKKLILQNKVKKQIQKKILDPTWSELIEKRKRKNRKPGIVEWEDKISAKEIASKYGECKVPETYFVTRSPKSIPFENLGSKYVVKANHLAGTKSVFLIDNGIDLFTGKKVSEKKIIKTEEEALKTTVGLKKREWATTQIKPKIIVEELLPNLYGGYDVINDFKCYTFHGRVCLVKMDYHRKKADAYSDYFDRDCRIIDWDPICLRDQRRNLKFEKKPEGWDQMIEIAEKLGLKFKNDKLGSFLRIDFYLTPNGVYFGEFTLYPGSGANTRFTKWVDKYLGLIWKKPEKYLENAFDKNFCMTNMKTI